MTERSQFTIRANFEYDGPIVFFTEDDGNAPVIPVDETIGWRMGAGRMAYVGFRDIGKNEFALAFNERRLHEALSSFIGATGIWSEDGRLPPMDVEAASVEHDETATTLYVQTTDGRFFGFRMNGKAAKQIGRLLASED